MKKTYEWLYDNYAEPLLKKMPPFSDEAVRRLKVPIPEGERIDWEDTLDKMLLDRCTAAFEAGVRLGISLTAS